MSFGTVGRHQPARVLKVLAFRLARARAHRRIVEPIAEEDAPLARREPLLVLLPLHAVVVVEPRVHLPAEVDLDVPAEATVVRLHLVGLVWGHLVVVAVWHSSRR